MSNGGFFAMRGKGPDDPHIFSVVWVDSQSIARYAVFSNLEDAQKQEALITSSTNIINPVIEAVHLPETASQLLRLLKDYTKANTVVKV